MTKTAPQRVLLGFTCGVLIIACRAEAHARTPGWAIGLEYRGGNIDHSITPVLISESQAAADVLEPELLKRTADLWLDLKLVKHSIMKPMLEIVDRYRKTEQRPDEKKRGDEVLVRIYGEGMQASFSLPVLGASLMIDDLKKLATKGVPFVSELARFQREVHYSSGVVKLMPGKTK